MTPKYRNTKVYSSNTIINKGDSNRYLPKKSYKSWLEYDLRFHLIYYFYKTFRLLFLYTIHYAKNITKPITVLISYLQSFMDSANHGRTQNT